MYATRYCSGTSEKLIIDAGTQKRQPVTSVSSASRLNLSGSSDHLPCEHTGARTGARRGGRTRTSQSVVHPSVRTRERSRASVVGLVLISYMARRAHLPSEVPREDRHEHGGPEHELVERHLGAEGAPAWRGERAIQKGVPHPLAGAVQQEAVARCARMKTRKGARAGAGRRVAHARTGQRDGGNDHRPGRDDTLAATCTCECM